MKQNSVLQLTAAVFATTVLLHAQGQSPSPAATASHPLNLGPDI